MICVAVTYVIRAGHEDQAARLFAELARATRQEPGCRMYVVHRALDDPRRYFLYEQYENAAALDAHRGADHFERLAKNGLWPITEERTPVVGTLLEM
jgi:quinol monooxygenase YgiN